MHSAMPDVLSPFQKIAAQLAFLSQVLIQSVPGSGRTMSRLGRIVNCGAHFRGSKSVTRLNSADLVIGTSFASSVGTDWDYCHAQAESDAERRARPDAGTHGAGHVHVAGVYGACAGHGCVVHGKAPSSDCCRAHARCADALARAGNGGRLNARRLDVVGRATAMHATHPTPPTRDAAPRKNPWGNLTGPTPGNGGCTSTGSTTTSISGSVTGPGL